MIFQRLNREGVTVVIVTHEPDIALHTRRKVLFKDGWILKDEIVENPVDAVALLEILRKQTINHI